MGVSESRQEMVSQLLSDVLEAAEARSGPLAVGKTPDKSASSSGKEVNYDRFGFRIEGDASSGTDATDSGKMLSRLWREAEEHLDAANDNLEEFGAGGPEGRAGGGDASSIEERWNEAITNLVKAKVPFAITSDVKDMLRLGIPISQRVSQS